MAVKAQAVVQRNKSNGSVLVEETTQLPQLEDHQVFVRIANAALNPTDGIQALHCPFRMLTESW